MRAVFIFFSNFARYIYYYNAKIPKNNIKPK